jgi:hypothetical protein
VSVPGCTPDVSKDDVYYSEKTDPNMGIAQNVVVEQTPEGMRVSGPEISVLALITKNSFEIKVDPEGAKIEQTIKQMELDSRTGTLIANANIKLGKDSTLPAKLPVKGAVVFIPAMYRFIPSATGSRNVSVKINNEVGYTEIAGLRFEQEVILNILEDGSVEVSKEGVVATDTKGSQWISKKVKHKNKIAVIMVRKK